MNLEIQLLINCCKTNPTAPDIQQIRTCITQFNRQKLAEITNLAHAHGIFPIVYHAIQEHAADLLTKESLAELKQDNLAIVMQNMSMTAELIRLMTLFEKNGIKALAFKGPSLAQLAYGDITLRQYCDLDILIPTKHLYYAATLLSNNSYTLHGALNFLNDPVWIDAAKDMTLSHDMKNISLEMHWKLFHSTFANHTPKVNLWHKTATVSINQVDIRTLNTELLLTYLCIHGSRHTWERLEWIADIDRLIRVMEIEWNNVLTIADQFESRTMLLLGLSLSHLLFDTALPHNLSQMVQTKKVERLTRLTIHLLEKPLPTPVSTTNILRRKCIHAAMQDTLYNKTMYWKSVFFHKNPTSILEENEPNKHNSLLNLKRPYQLIKKFIFKQSQ